LHFRIAWRYDWPVIVSFRHKGLRAFYETGSTRGIQRNMLQS
jgi:plasmid maintenance system killer protein